SLPVMEGKAQLFSAFAGLKSVPIVWDTQDVDELVDTITRLAPSFGAINLEYISAPRRFASERRLMQKLASSVMHDDPHGPAVVILAALRTSLKLLGRELADLKIVISGAGAAGVAPVDMLTNAGATDIIVLDSRGVIQKDRTDLSPTKQELAAKTNPRNLAGVIKEDIRGAALIIGVF